MTERKIVMYIIQTVSISILRKKRNEKICTQDSQWEKYLRNNSSSRISKGKSPIKRIVRVEETSNSPLQARGEHRKIVMIKGRNGTENQLNKTLQTVNSNITKRYLVM